jgi:hypothetical protein
MKSNNVICNQNNNGVIMVRNIHLHSTMAGLIDIIIMRNTPLMTINNNNVCGNNNNNVIANM